jgi:NADP-reducing hydrogenase subunit HndB
MISRAELARRWSSGKAARDAEMRGRRAIEVLVCMGTSGMASGAKQTLEAMQKELAEQGLSGVTLRQTGSMGLDHAEPTVEVHMPDMPDTIYGHVDPETAVRIVRKHILGKTLVNDKIYDRPAVDMFR